MKLSKLLSLLLACVMLFACTACDGEESNPQGTNNNNANDNSNISTNDNGQEKVTYQDSVNDAYADEKYGFQLDAPEEGETVAIMHTGMGDISIRFFPEAAPKAVENFLTHAKDGYYDGLTFHRIIDDFMIQGGDPEGTGAGGENIWGTKGFEDEFNKKLMNLRGSLAMANSGVNTNGSQFFINQAGPTGKSAEELAEQYSYESMINQMAGTYDMYVQYYGESFTTYYPDLESFISANGGISPDSRVVPAEVWKLYAEIGGNIHLDGAWRQSGGHTVFGQVYDGMDVVDAIAMVETDKDGKPNKKVLIKSIDVITYSK